MRTYTPEIPVFCAQVPERLRSLSGASDAITCNLRPEQRPVKRPQTEEEILLHDIEGRHYGFYVHLPLREFLDSLGNGAKVLIHFQGRGQRDIWTAVVRVDAVDWVREENCPYLVLKDPKVVRPAHEGPILWGTFILAIAPAPCSDEIPALRDNDAAEFIRLASAFHALPLAA